MAFYCCQVILLVVVTFENSSLFKILFDGYLMIRQFLNQLPLIIKRFLFDGYLMIGVNNPEFLCNCHETGRCFSNAKSLITKTILYMAYVTGTPFWLRIKSVSSPILYRKFSNFTQLKSE